MSQAEIEALKQIKFALRLHRQTQQMLVGLAPSNYGKGYLDALEWATGLIETLQPKADEPNSRASSPHQPDASVPRPVVQDIPDEDR